ncbi:FHA domain-containing protein [Nannocystaceae bacterium ST9]
MPASSSEVPALTFVAGSKPGGVFPLGPEGESWVAGRSNDADLVLADDTVSRKHARIYRARDTLWVRDLGSRNGTQVNGRAVRQQRLREGDRITIGANLLRLDMVPISQVVRTKPRAEESNPSAGRSMSGSIQDIPLADVLQWLATSRKTGMLRVRGTSVGEMFLRQGRVYYARIQGSAGLPAQKALLRMMGWAEGTFELDNNTVEPDGDELSVSLEHILMEAARMQDELAHLAERFGIPTGRVDLILPAPSAWRALPPAQLDIIQSVVEGWQWAQILDRLAADDVELTRAIIEMRKNKLVRY